MLILIETIIIVTILYYLSKIVFKNESDTSMIPKSLAIAILIVGVLVLPPPIKAMIIVILIIAFVANTINKRAKL
ncbi:MAG: hypothetical protein NTW78_05330 [Campylobacterales bacterium]|nr:hypothetical protein [Campylobacterales bacterium]